MQEDSEDVADGSRRRKDDRESAVEDVLAGVRADLGERSYPTTSERLASTYADEPTEFPNETESLGSAFDRIDDQFADADEAWAALLAEFEQGQYARGYTEATRTGGDTWSEERIDDERPPAEQNTEGQTERATERARRAQAADADAGSSPASAAESPGSEESGSSSGPESDGDE